MKLEAISSVAVSDAMSHEDVITLVEDMLSVEADADLDIEIVKHVKIFGVLERLNSVHARKLSLLYRQKTQVERKRTMHYDGKMPAEHYQRDPLSVAVLKGDIPKLLDFDPVVVEIRTLFDEQDRIVKTIERAKEQLRARTWDIKNILEYRKMLLGA